METASKHFNSACRSMLLSLKTAVKALPSTSATGQVPQRSLGLLV